MTLREFMQGRRGAEVICAMTGQVVRQLAVVDNRVDLKAADGAEVGLALDEKVTYFERFMDRGDFVLLYNGSLIKLCTEHDIVRFDDGSLAHAERRMEIMHA